jgi:hypothetical protein
MCISDVFGHTFPSEWTERLKACLEEAFDLPVAVNQPFQGGYIIRRHSAKMPWIQIEFSRAPFLPSTQKRDLLLKALKAFCGIF